MTYQERLDTIVHECQALSQLSVDLAKEKAALTLAGEVTTEITLRRTASIRVYFELMLERGAILKHLADYKLRPDDEIELRRVAAQ